MAKANTDGKGQRKQLAPENQRRPVMDKQRKERMLAVLLRNVDAFKVVREFLHPEHFSDQDNPYRLIWQKTCEFFDENERLPEAGFLSDEITQAIDADPGRLDETEHEDINNFIDWAWDVKAFDKDPVADVDGFYKKWAVTSAKKFLQERIAAKLKAAVEQKNTVPVDLPSIMAAISDESDRIEGMTADEVKVAFPLGWDKKASLNVWSTGLSFYDFFLGGGQANGEVYGLMGPFGSCKTTQACQIVVEGAKHFYQTTMRPGYDGRKTLSFIVSYEARLQEMRNRTLGYAAKIRRETLEAMEDAESDLSRRGEIKDYEERIYADVIRNQGIAAVDGEYERAMANIGVLNDHMVLIDMTGHETKGVGNGGVDEIARMITHELRKRGNARCGVVIVDYVGAMVKRYMDAHDISSDQLRHHVSGTPLRAKHKLADAFNCPVWLLHQFNGDANSRSPAVLLHHTDAAEAKNFAENLDFCFCVGTVDEQEQAAQVGCTKHRRQPGKNSVVIRIDGAMNKVIDGRDTHAVNTHLKRIMKHSDNSRLPDGVAETTATPPRQRASETNIDT